MTVQANASIKPSVQQIDLATILTLQACRANIVMQVIKFKFKFKFKFKLKIKNKIKI